MPVQINEMIIRANIVETDDSAHETTNTQPADAGALNKSEIIKECAELVMEIINNKNKR